jgi:hypothetical protein
MGNLRPNSGSRPLKHWAQQPSDPGTVQDNQNAVNTWAEAIARRLVSGEEAEHAEAQDRQQGSGKCPSKCKNHRFAPSGSESGSMMPSVRAEPTWFHEQVRFGCATVANFFCDGKSVGFGKQT